MSFEVESGGHPREKVLTKTQPPPTATVWGNEVYWMMDRTMWVTSKRDQTHMHWMQSIRLYSYVSGETRDLRLKQIPRNLWDAPIPKYQHATRHQLRSVTGLPRRRLIGNQPRCLFDECLGHSSHICLNFYICDKWENQPVSPPIWGVSDVHTTPALGRRRLAY